MDCRARARASVVRVMCSVSCDRFESVEFLPPWQEKMLSSSFGRAEAANESMTQAGWNFMKDVTVSLNVAGRRDCRKRDFRIVCDAVKVWEGVHLRDATGVRLSHDGRHRDMQSKVRFHTCGYLVGEMVRILMLIAGLVVADAKDDYIEVLVWCEAGRHRSMSFALWMAKVGAALNIRCLVHMLPWNWKLEEDKRCPCEACNEEPRGLQCFHLADAHRVVDELAKMAAKTCPRMQGIVRRTAGTMLRYLRQIELDFVGKPFGVGDEEDDVDERILAEGLSSGESRKRRRYADGLQGGQKGAE